MPKMINGAMLDFALKIVEAATLNVKDEETEFPNKEYRVFIKRHNPRLKTPIYLNVESKKEGFHVLVSTAGKLIQVKKFGTRDRGDRFSDICEKVKKFMKEKSGISKKFDEIDGATTEHVVKLLWKMTELKTKQNDKTHENFRH